MIKTFLFSLCPLLCWGDAIRWQAESEEEALFMNRVADFWEEGEYQIAKNQIEEFLKTYPNSVFADSLYAALGDLFLREKKPSQALECYTKIKGEETATSVWLPRMQCLYDMQWYAILADECQALLELHEDPSEEQTQATYYLAIALYHLCLNAEKEPELLRQLALRAQPYFETLFQSPLGHEVAGAFAHLCCILKDFPKAASIYLHLATEETQEEMLFQAALVQTEYDKPLALQTFEEICSLHGLKQKEAAFNLLLLSFDLKKYEALIEAKETILEQIPSDKIGIAHLYFGQSFLSLQKGKEACLELQMFLSDKSANTDKETIKAALCSFLEASFLAQDLDSFEEALTQMESQDLKGDDFFKGKLLKTRLLQKKNQLLLAEEELTYLLSETKEPNLRQQALLELTQLNHQTKNWVTCRKNAVTFLSDFSNHPAAPQVEQILLYALTELVNQGLLEKEELLAHLQTLVDKEKDLPLETRFFREFLMAKTLVALGQHEKALPVLQQILASSFFSQDPIQEANIQILLAMCYKEGLHDIPHFCSFTENALSLLNNNIENPFDLGSLHASLYNAYLEISISDPPSLEKAKEHLFAAFTAKTPIAVENLLWLADGYAKKGDSEGKAAEILQSLSQQKTSESEQIKICKLLMRLHKNKEAIDLLEKSSQQNETALLLGELYASCGMTDQALSLFESLTKDKSILKTEIGASAYLQGARLKTRKWIHETPSANDPEFQQVLTQFKDIVLQKNISFEPLYLEAALDYIDLQNRFHASPTKKLFLLQKTKQDFESAEDLLSKDYHIARQEMEDKNQIYESYMAFLEAEILAVQSQLNLDENEQKELQAKAKNLLLKIVEEQAHPALVARANQCLNP